MNVHKGWAFPRGIYSEVHSPITTPEIICVMALTLQPMRGCPQHSGETGTRLSSAVHRRLLSRFLLREGWRLYTGYHWDALAPARKARLPCRLSFHPPPPLYSRESLLAGCGPAEISIGYLDVLSRRVPVLVKFSLENYITGKLRFIKPRRIKLKKRKGGDKLSK